MSIHSFFHSFRSTIERWLAVARASKMHRASSSLHSSRSPCPLCVLCVCASFFLFIAHWVSLCFLGCLHAFHLRFFASQSCGVGTSERASGRERGLSCAATFFFVLFYFKQAVYQAKSVASKPHASSHQDYIVDSMRGRLNRPNRGGIRHDGGITNNFSSCVAPGPRLGFAGCGP